MVRNCYGSFFVVLMFILQSWALSVHAPNEELSDSIESLEVVPAPSALNTAGFHEGNNDGKEETDGHSLAI